MTVEAAKIIFEHIVSPSLGIIFLICLALTLFVPFISNYIRACFESSDNYQSKRKKIDDFVLEEIKRREDK